MTDSNPDQGGPAKHLCLVLSLCRGNETKPDFAGPPRRMTENDWIINQHQKSWIIRYLN
jgi:hypothetical protein